MLCFSCSYNAVHLGFGLLVARVKLMFTRFRHRRLRHDTAGLRHFAAFQDQAQGFACQAQTKVEAFQIHTQTQTQEPESNDLTCSFL